MMEAVRAYKTSVYSSETIRGYIPEGSHLHGSFGDLKTDWFYGSHFHTCDFYKNRICYYYMKFQTKTSEIYNDHLVYRLRMSEYVHLRCIWT
jgi:hypothetical protein